MYLRSSLVLLSLSLLAFIDPIDLLEKVGGVAEGVAAVVGCILGWLGKKAKDKAGQKVKNVP